MGSNRVYAKRYLRGIRYARRSLRVAGVDVGSTKVAVVIGEIKEQSLEITGVGSHPSSGVYNGIILDLEMVANSIRRAVDKAERMSGYKIPPAQMGISGSHLEGSYRDVTIAIHQNEVTQRDLNRVIEIVMAGTLPQHRKVIHVLPLDFTIDDKYGGIQNPLGMSGTRLEAEVLFMTGEATYINHLIRSCRRAGVEVAGITVAPLASSEAVLTEDEKEQGSVLLDIGGEVSELAIFYQGAMVYSTIVKGGGNQLTQALATAFLTPTNDAEQLKIKYGSALSYKSYQDQTLAIPGSGGGQSREYHRETLVKILQSEIINILNQLNEEIHRSLCRNLLAAGCILTGGTALLPGIDTLTERIFNLPVRVGYPRDISGLVGNVESPAFSTAVGLAKLGRGNSSSINDLGGVNRLGQVTTTLKEWLRNLKIASQSDSH